MHAISILGSTGSIGASTLEVVDTFSDHLRVVGLSAGGNVELLARQVQKYRPELVSVRSADLIPGLRDLLGHEFNGLEIVCGPDGASAVATLSTADAVVAGIVGAAGIPPVHAALAAGKRVGIANKEVLVSAGDVMTSAAERSGGEILPIDSEHCAVHQCLMAGRSEEVDRIILTASGGPFLRTELAAFESITVDEALNHPTWKMGNKITIDSATMMNKGLEVIEAHHLFRHPVEKIGILIHPQSIVHSMVEYVDGSIIAQLSTTDMKFPIQYCLLYPERIPAPFEKLDLAQISQLEFLEVDGARFPAVRLAYEACETGGSMPAVLNAANEIAVERFLAGQLGYTGIPEVVAEVMEKHSGEVSEIGTVDDALHWDGWAREEARAVEFV
ncbi:MAG: 1-deoxy-D-xylulose-5-phosphate reductoisomerase [Thermoanaerobaculia bacterium]|nr:1-deoxy-D-xylulose-5-phosphate reductoisomerase [Thermoanaerobaculia bacterium]